MVSELSLVWYNFNKINAEVYYFPTVLFIYLTVFEVHRVEKPSKYEANAEKPSRDDQEESGEPDEDDKTGPSKCHLHTDTEQ